MGPYLQAEVAWLVRRCNPEASLDEEQINLIVKEISASYPEHVGPQGLSTEGLLSIYTSGLADADRDYGLVCHGNENDAAPGPIPPWSPPPAPVFPSPAASPVRGGSLSSSPLRSPSRPAAAFRGTSWSVMDATPMQARSGTFHPLATPGPTPWTLGLSGGKAAAGSQAALAARDAAAYDEERVAALAMDEEAVDEDGIPKSDAESVEGASQERRSSTCSPEGGDIFAGLVTPGYPLLDGRRGVAGVTPGTALLRSLRRTALSNVRPDAEVRAGGAAAPPTRLPIRLALPDLDPREFDAAALREALQLSAPDGSCVEVTGAEAGRAGGVVASASLCLAQDDFFDPEAALEEARYLMTVLRLEPAQVLDPGRFGAVRLLDKEERDEGPMSASASERLDVSETQATPSADVFDGLPTVCKRPAVQGTPTTGEQTARATVLVPGSHPREWTAPRVERRGPLGFLSGGKVRHPSAQETMLTALRRQLPEGSTVQFGMPVPVSRYAHKQLELRVTVQTPGSAPAGPDGQRAVERASGTPRLAGLENASPAYQRNLTAPLPGTPGARTDLRPTDTYVQPESSFFAAPDSPSGPSDEEAAFLAELQALIDGGAPDEAPELRGSCSGARAARRGPAEATRRGAGPVPEECRAIQVKTHVNLGISLEADGLLLAACDEYRRATELDPAHFRAFKLLGSVLYAVGDFSGAKSALKSALRLKPGYGDAHCDLGCVYCALEQHTQAKRQFENAIACDPWHLEAHFNRGNLLRQSGDLPGAIESYDRVLAADPGHWRSLLNKAVVQTCLGAAKEEAAENLRLAMKLSGNSSLLQQEVDQLRRMLKQGANWGSVSQMMSFISDRAAQVASVSKAPTAPAPGEADGRRPASPLASRLLRTLTPSKTRLGRGRSSEEPELDGAALEAARSLDRQALSAELDVPVLQQLGPLARVEPRDVVQLLERMAQSPRAGLLITMAEAEALMREALLETPPARFQHLMRTLHSQVLVRLAGVDRRLDGYALGMLTVALSARSGLVDRLASAYAIAMRRRQPVTRRDAQTFARQLRLVFSSSHASGGEAAGPGLADEALDKHAFHDAVCEAFPAIGVLPVLCQSVS
ncbi:hypothetical protein QBZ16_003049 [Prototheca wickerhamii]|uniref:Uncharacterized protein n=1 Tax=Prototheca wickerhamii TaxID=3111 RepID=A0AAD9IJB2_PROWI|nr:hypothetical protein QBZ16_003049 [Prototheca wickerhamii]